MSPICQPAGRLAEALCTSQRACISFISPSPFYTIYKLYLPHLQFNISEETAYSAAVHYSPSYTLGLSSAPRLPARSSSLMPAWSHSSEPPCAGTLQPSQVKPLQASQATSSEPPCTGALKPIPGLSLSLTQVFQPGQAP